MMKKTMLLCLVFLFMGYFCTMDAGDKQFHSEGRGFFMAGFHTIDVGDLSTALTANGYPKVDNQFISMGGCGYAILNDRLLIGGEGHGLVGDKNSANGYELSLVSGYGLFNIGYIVMKKGDLSLYPMFGIGGGGFTLKIVQEQGRTFDEMLADPDRGVELNSGGLTLSVALGVDYLINMSKDAREKGGLAFGLRLGYNYTPLVGDWLYEAAEISGGPEIGITGPFVKLMFGGGGGSTE
ncbi:hypothetical protein JXO59_16825 [candidate division KSB1 bacterium]|nr:hypothetical protein [candidate division KSB1 bacterium]